ncbi:type IV pili methyl-accepting chemotaxis transducer N-terminal domain-containing protein [Halopseudomonas salegens]|uniref:Sensor protein n=1 Tax=Halopseudomonas salegens TaxID=1434072 RepID=A0A1H2F7U9_9GAMM|nr:type IV pili methyl-accepting chemotaxis transducer N-terminal domain-containing protein [Halopseudomonas salegens]SDU03323.1 two-component system, NarL family, nitrate/nitrite sensor histidine kinase NarX [Halopseudomonas salegens]
MLNTPSDSLTPRHSVVFHTLLAFVVIIAVSVLSLLGNLYMAEALGGDAAAINQAGSLRMQSYRLALTASQNDPQLLQAHLNQLDETLTSSALRSTVRRHPDSSLPAHYAEILEHWSQVMRPRLATQPPRLELYRNELDSFTSELDRFVSNLQLASERKLGVIRVLQVGTLFIIVLIAFLLIYRLHNNLASPLRALTAMARQIGGGNFNSRVQVAGDTELSLLARTLNQMSQELAELYAEMEQKVSDKTAELRRSNASLHLLFNGARMLYSKPEDPAQMMGQLLEKVQQTLGSGPVSLCLNRPGEVGSHTAMSSLDLLPPYYCNLPQCDNCPAHSNQGLLANGNRLIGFELRSGNSELGALRVEHPAEQALEPWQEQLMTTLADLFAASLSLASQSDQQARLALMEERAVIARELHDSLAQALSAQKLQVARFKRLAARGADTDTLNATAGEIEQGLNAAYRQLRELLTTFRIKVNAPGLKPALLATVDEFSSNSGLLIHFHYQLDHCPLSPNEEIHCLQVIREALSNVLKHAKASQCWLNLYQDRSGTIQIQIEDNGIGIDTDVSPSGHYGLTILRERAEGLHGSVSIDTGDKGGARIWLSFPPAYRRIPLKQESNNNE